MTSSKPRFCLGDHLPRHLAVPLFGDREAHGLQPIACDPDWQEWERRAMEIYLATQTEGLGRIVNHAEYRVMRRVDLAGKQVLEVGPGSIGHHVYWRARPALYTLADRRQEMLDRSRAILEADGVAVETRLMSEGDRGLPFADASFDVLVSFNSFEHLHPFQDYLEEMLRVLKPGGRIVGGIPAEGGLAWGVGRLLTTRRWFRKHTSIDLDKVICWEHPNFANTVLAALDAALACEYRGFWPFGVASIDLNAVISFVYRKA
ncbi:MAG: hypothetical protein Kow00114_31000 [Kiloniellaceae bacterium]